MTFLEFAMGDPEMKDWKIYNSRELTYIIYPQKGTFEDDFPFPVGWDMNITQLERKNIF